MITIYRKNLLDKYQQSGEGSDRCPLGMKNILLMNQRAMVRHLRGAIFDSSNPPDDRTIRSLL